MSVSRANQKHCKRSENVVPSFNFHQRRRVTTPNCKRLTCGFLWDPSHVWKRVKTVV